MISCSFYEYWVGWGAKTILLDLHWNLLDYYSICLSEWKDTFQISILRIFGRAAKFGHNASGSKVLTIGSNFKIDLSRSSGTYFDAS